MKIVNKKAFEGRNIYSHKKCIRVELDLQGYAEIPSKDIPGFNEKLLELLPELYTHRCGIDEDGGFVIRLREGTYLSHICEHMILALQNKLGIDVAYGKAREIKGEFYYIIFQYEYKNTAFEVLRLAVDIINSLINDRNINFNDRFKIIQEILNNEVIGPSTRAIKEAANRHGLPVMQLGDSGFYQIGYGKQARIIEATIGSKTSCVSTDISCDKLLTKELLMNQHIPVADGAMVYNVISLLKEAEKIGYPVVIKPRYGSKGNGVIVNIKNEKELIRAYNSLKDKYKELMIEKYITGNDYRVCVVNYKVVAVSRRIPPKIIGNGIDNVKELIRKLNTDPKRGYDHEKQLTKIKIDNEVLRCLENQGFALLSIPVEGEEIWLRENANLSTGGMALDYTDRICKENIDICIRVAKSIGLDICGIDITAEDISKPLKDNGVIMEVNAAPGIRMHNYPTEGVSRDVGEAILNMQYEGKAENIPVVSVTGTNGKTTTTRLISYVLKLIGYKVGMTSTDGIYIDGKCIDKGDDTGFFSAKTILQNRDVEVAVLETARGGLIRNGLAYDLADVAIITNITEDHIGINGIDNMEQLCYVKSLVGEAVKPNGYTIINGDDYWSKTIINRLKGNLVCFSKNKDNPLIIECINKGGIAVFIEEDNIVVVNKNRKYKIIDIKDMPLTMGGILDFNIENAMAACGALVSLGIDYCMITKGFLKFKSDNVCNSGRFNLYNLKGVKIILDYGHNPEGYKSIIKSLQKIERNKLIGVIGMPGDRQDEAMMEIGRLSSESMDYVYIKEDKDRRGRKLGEVAKVIEKGINKNNYEICLDEIEALKLAYNRSEAGDIIIVFYEKLEPVLRFIKELAVEEEEDLDIV